MSTQVAFVTSLRKANDARPLTGWMPTFHLLRGPRV